MDRQVQMDETDQMVFKFHILLISLQGVLSAPQDLKDLQALMAKWVQRALTDIQDYLDGLDNKDHQDHRDLLENPDQTVTHFLLRQDQQINKQYFKAVKIIILLQNLIV